MVSLLISMGFLGMLGLCLSRPCPTLTPSKMRLSKRFLRHRLLRAGALLAKTAVMFMLAPRSTSLANSRVLHALDNSLAMSSAHNVTTYPVRTGTGVFLLHPGSTSTVVTSIFKSGFG